MSQRYSQVAAFFALVKASVRSMVKSPSSVVFSIAFPLVFILVFGFIGDRATKIKIGIPLDADVSTSIFKALSTDPQLQISMDSLSVLKSKFQDGQIQAIIDVNQKDAGQGKQTVSITSGKHNQALVEQLSTLVKAHAVQADSSLQHHLDNVVAVQQHFVDDKEYKLIDFILPGQLGFSLLAASVFGTAFVFYHMRQLLVLKRFFATPVRKSVILLGEGTARLIFQLVGAILIILIGKYFFDYTLINGWFTVVNMLIVSAFGLLVFMSFGFIISGIAKSDSVIPPLANIVTMPQFLLAGTFFSVDALPTWLQYLAKIMPLTYFNNALRYIAFDGAGLWDVKGDLLILGIWGVIGYAAAAKLFKWE